MIPTLDAVERAVRDIEVSQHRSGWDQPPRVFVLMGDQTRVRHLVLPVTVKNPPGEFLKFMADYLRSNPEGQSLVQDLAQPEFAGLAVCLESWANMTLSPAERAADPRRLADIPGSKEARDVMAVDTAGRMHMVHRLRGDKPIGDMTQVTGRVPAALLSMVITVAEALPPDEADLDALHKVHLLTEAEAEETIQRIRRSQAATES